MTSLVDRREVEKLLVLAAALRSGMVDALDVPERLSPEEVAGRLEGDPYACRVMLEALASIGVVDHTDAGFALTALGRLHLIDPPAGEPVPPELERSSLLHQAHKFEGWLRLPRIVAGERGSSGPRPPDRLRSFVRTMGEGDPAAPAEVVEAALAYSREGGAAQRPRDMIDVGGAVGHMARLFAERGLHATLFDRPEVLPEARAFLGADADRIDMVGGDFIESLPEGPFDLAYLGNVYHIYGPEALAALTARVFRVLRPGGVICVRDYVWERSPRAAMFAVNMLQATADGGVWHETQYRAWLEQAGFADVRVLDLTASTSQLIMGRRADG